MSEQFLRPVMTQRDGLMPDVEMRGKCHRACRCRERCGDVWEPEGGPGIDEPPWPVCKGLPRTPTPLVEIVRRSDSP